MPGTPKVERKLAAIMFTDIAGYTALSSQDEDKALNLLDKQRKLLQPIVKEFSGVINKEIGDGLLITFPIVSKAVRCAIQIQKVTQEIDDLNLRIGIHEGEITERDGDVLGDDVNVASRIEPFSAIGGVAISGKVQQNISSITEFKTKFIGQPKLKGVSQKVEVHCIISHGLPKTEISEVSAKLEKETSQNSIFKFTGAALTVLGISFWVAVGIFDISFGDESEVPSIAILPLHNKGAVEDEFYAYGISSDLISDVTSAGLIRVASLNEIEELGDISFKEKAKQLFVRYVAQGTIWKRDNIFQLSMELYDIKTEKVIWSERWQKNWNELPVIRDVLAENILEKLKVDFITETQGYAVNPDAYELYLKAKHKYIKRKNTDDIEIVRGLLHKAIELDKNLLAAKNLIGNTYMALNVLDKALLYFNTALEEAEILGDIREKGSSLYNMGNYSFKLGDHETGLTYFQEALKIYENLNDKNGIGEIYIKYADYYWMKDDLETAVEYDKKSLKLYEELGDLRGVGINLVGIGIYYSNIKKDNKEALNYYNKSLKIFKENGFKSNMPYSLICLGQTYSEMGDLDVALEYYNKVYRIEEELGLFKYKRVALLSKMNIYNIKGDFENSVRISKNSLKQFEINDDQYALAYSLINLAIVHYNEKEYNKALEYLEKSQRIHKNLELPKPPLSTAIYLNLIYKHLNNQYNLKDIQNLIKETENIGYEDNFRLYELFEDNSFLEKAYEIIKEKVDTMVPTLKEYYLNYPIPKAIVEEWERIS